MIDQQLKPNNIVVGVTALPPVESFPSPAGIRHSLPGFPVVSQESSITRQTDSYFFFFNGLVLK